MKYKLTEETITVGGKTLYRIQALKDFREIKSGDLGGFVGSEKNLSQDDNAWVFDKAKVFSDAKVFGNAKIRRRASVLNDAKFSDKVDVSSVANITLEMSSGNIEDSSYFKKITLYHKN